MEKMNNIFNTILENSIRFLLLLKEIYPKSISKEKICALDFITIYGKEFKLTPINLQGDNSFGFSEYLSKRKNMAKFISFLVKKGLIDLDFDNEGYLYKINALGIDLVNKFESDYAFLYEDFLNNVIDKYLNFNEKQLFDVIFKVKGENDGKILD